MNANFNLYKYFYIVAKYLSFTKAAEYLLISQPSLSYSVKTLEDQLGYKLFKKGNKLELTLEGQKLYELLAPSIEAIMNINLETISGNVKIAVPPLFGNELMPKYLNLFESMYPDIHIIVKVREYDEMLEDFENGKVDLMISDKLINTTGFESYYIKGSNLSTCLYIGKKFEKEHNDEITLEDIKDKEISLVETNKYIYDFINMYPNVKYKEYFSTPLLIDKVQKEDLIVLAPKIYADIHEKMGEIKILNTKFKLPDIEMTITKKKNDNSLVIKTVIDLFLNYDLFDAYNNF